MSYGYEPLLALGVRLYPRDAAMAWVEQHVEHFTERFGEDTVNDMRWAIVGDREAAWRAARAIAPTAAIWFDGREGDSWRTSYWNGASRGHSKFAVGLTSEAAAILGTGINAYAAGLERA